MNQSNTIPSIVSANLRISGNLTSEGDVQVEGTIEGDVRSRSLNIGEGGAVNGEIRADQVTVSGSVTGKMTARTVNLTRTARVNGDIVHETLSIEAGARFEGTCKRQDGGDRKAPAATRPATEPATGG